MTAASRRAPQSLLRRAARATLATGLVALAAACQSQTEARVGVGAGVAIPQASFSEGVTSGLPGLTVQFTSTSTGSVDRYAWDFGPLGTRSEPNPVVTFDQPGSYTVALTVYGGPGSTTGGGIATAIGGEKLATIAHTAATAASRPRGRCGRPR